MACSALNIWGLKESSVANIILTCIEVGGLVLVILAGVTHGDLMAPMLAPIQPGIIPAAALIFFVYLGFEEIANMTEEVRNPAKDLPLAIFASLGITTLLYVLVAISVVAIIRPDELVGSEAPLADALSKVWPHASIFLSAVALFATANTVLITLIAASRLAFSMSRDGEIPHMFGALLQSRGTPWTAAILVLVLSAALLPISDLKSLAEVSSLSALLAFLAVNIALIVLRYRMPERHRPFRSPINAGRFPILPMLAIGTIGVLLPHFDLKIYGVVAGAFALLSLWAFLRWTAGSRARRQT